MPPKKKAKLLKKIPEDAKWCLDRSNHLSFREFIEKWDCLDRNQAQQRFGNILSDYFNEIIDIVTEQRLKSLQTTAASNGASSGDSSALNVSSNSSVPEVSDYSSAFDISDDSSAPNEPTSLTNIMLIGVKDYLVSVMNNFVNEEDTNDNPWMFEDINISHLFRKYQAATSEILVKHKTLPVESYVHELASLTHILFLCKDQHSEIAEKVFSLETLQQLTAFLEQKIINHSLDFPSNHFMTITNTFTDLSLAEKTREQAIMEFTVLASQMNYGQKRLLYGITNLESELWSTYFDPLLSCLISDPDRLIHLRWTNAIPMEKGKNRPDAVISEKRQMSFGNSVGYGEAKTLQGSCSKSLCLDTLRLAIFTKNAIDINKLDGALAFQIHGFNIIFYLQQLTAKGIYTFIEIAHFRFPQSLDDLPSLFTMINIKKLLGVSDVFWSLCRKSKQPDIIEERYRRTLVSLDAMIDTAQDSTRRCVLRFGH
ncbi:hypothetical protein G6F46_011695 [Rhizopus delemar]|uniref:Uncharacterized protein n=2 Tax=Rhizopus TaxID=4842 RepID=A0A9P7CJ81_9FUNG|nr:hypothetical protein G6F55_009462 [Rhizopus delemar]KAG1534986.1 hypothetical protein G6F51_011783 [Rhizopus arrhizus]KAG1489407.1 hypothetical protein G6F54_011460 [Rhizopus delemar]KAG1514755.1 hypothetical protein G6F53_003429 [Rhizopus delemar]KAG1524057.1 hypothetical protein G6F52_004510 [Rhizopus delemar]